MIKIFLVISLVIVNVSAAQTVAANENELESTIGESNVDNDNDDLHSMQWEQLKNNPVNLNTADAEDLKQLLILSQLQIHSFLSYRKFFGRLTSIYEIQAVPHWDIETINKIKSFVVVTDEIPVLPELKTRLKAGQHLFLLRGAQTLERSAGYKDRNYLGGPQKILFRYKYSFKNLFQYGILAEKDAGEPMITGKVPGFDFYSAFLHLANIGKIKTLVIGDFIVNMGQGLIQWQGMGQRKGAEVLSVKRQSSIIVPYNSAGEFYFNRGIAITLKGKHLSQSLFISSRSLSATTTGQQNEQISSLHSSGLHRTASEILKKNELSQKTIGATITVQKNSWQCSINSVYYQFSKPFQEDQDPYSIYSIAGNNWFNASIDYGFTSNNFHVFGEFAIDKNKKLASLNGILTSLDQSVDLALLIRKIPEEYKAMYASAFVDNTTVSNETGFFFGIQVRPVHRWKLSLYADWFQFPWLKYRVNAPSIGQEYLLLVNYLQGKNADCYMRWTFQRKEANITGDSLPIIPLQTFFKTNWRTHVNFKVNKSITLRNRVELCSVRNLKGMNKNGFLAFADIIIKPNLKPYDIVIRLETFESDDYDTRIYTYENDVQYSYSVPALFDTGSRYYILLRYDLNSKFSTWLRCARTIYKFSSSLGSGPDEIAGNLKTEIKLQMRYIFN